MSRGRDYQTRPAKEISHSNVEVPQNRVNEQPQKRVVKEYRRCPLCYTGELNGIGIANGTYSKSQTLGVRFYKCDRCGHTWSVTFKPEEIISINNDDE